MKDALRAIEEQIDKNKHLNLLYDHLEEAVQVHEFFAQVLADISRPNYGEMETLVSHAVERTVSTLYEINQFLSITPERKDELRRIYLESWERYDPDRPSASIQAHHTRLSRWISRLYPDHFKEALRSKQTIGRLTNAQYSAEFQIRVLGLDLDGLLEPIIDMGCGSRADLVRRIHIRKRDVLGIDRKINGTLGRTREIDWFDFPFEPSHYGTVIANMSFSNHLLFHLSNGTKDLLQYLLKYKEILESLKPGGMFVYAPSLPLVEERLDHLKYTVVIREAGKGNTVTRIRCLG